SRPADIKFGRHPFKQAPVNVFPLCVELYDAVVDTVHDKLPLQLGGAGFTARRSAVLRLTWRPEDVVPRIEAAKETTAHNCFHKGRAQPCGDGFSICETL